MSAVLQPLEALQRNAALGIRFWDVAGATSAIDGLAVEVFPRANPAARKRMRANPSGIYVAHVVSGLRGFEFDPSDPADLPWTHAPTSPARGYRVEVSDPQGRFLPLAFDADLPWRGMLDLSAALPPMLPAALIWSGESGSPPQMLVERVPLFSAPSRPVPQPLAVVYAQLLDLGTRRIPAWSLLGVDIDGVLQGLGLADQEGRVAVMFPYPEPPRRPLTSPPEAHSDFRWTVVLSAYSAAASSPPLRAPDFPDLATVLGQLSTPCSVVDSLSSPAAPRRLEYRVPMTARTEGLPGADASYLMLTHP